MSILTKPPPVLLFMAFIYSKSAEFNPCLKILENNFGPISLESKVFQFDHSEYYKKEMGDNLTRKVIGFQNLIERDKLVEIKILTNSLEDQFSIEERRTINIDPGYISGEHLILATGKGFYHRPYIGKGVYADLTLVYQQNNYKPLEWTYPDYYSEDLLGVFYKLREIYTEILKEGNNQ